jgi:hypothetical protein
MSRSLIEWDRVIIIIIIIIIQFIPVYLCAKLNSPEANYKASTGKKMRRVRSKKESENNVLIKIKIIKYKMTKSTLLLLLITTNVLNYYITIIIIIIIISQAPSNQILIIN